MRIVGRLGVELSWVKKERDAAAATSEEEEDDDEGKEEEDEHVVYIKGALEIFSELISRKLKLLLIISPLSSYSFHRSNGISHTVRVPSILPFPKPHSKTPNLPKSSFFNPNSLAPLRLRGRFLVGTSIREAEEEISASPNGFPVGGEYSAAFDLGEQKPSSWVYFSGILGTVLFALNFV